MSTPRCRAKTFPCPAGERCPAHRGIHEALEYSIQQADFNQFLDLKNKLLPRKNAPASRDIHIQQGISEFIPSNTSGSSNAYHAAYTAFKTTWTKAQKSAVYYYTEGDMHRRINIWLRNRRHSDINTWDNLEREVVESLDQLTQGDYQRANAHTPLWRAVNGSHADRAEKYKIGDIITEHAYTSTTSDPASVNAFVEDGHPVIYQIFTKKGVPVSRRAESEYLLPRGMRFKVTGRTRANIVIDGTIRARNYQNALLLTLHEIED